MKPSPRLERRARLREAESAERIAEQKMRIAPLRAKGKDATAAAKLLDQLRVAHRLMVEQLATEGRDRQVESLILWRAARR